MMIIIETERNNLLLLLFLHASFYFPLQIAKVNQVKKKEKNTK